MPLPYTYIMQQFSEKIRRDIIRNAKSNSINFLIGENGSGKSLTLSQLTYVLLEHFNADVLAISNCSHTRFPIVKGLRNYSRLLPGQRNAHPSDFIKRLLVSASNKSRWADFERDLKGLMRVFDYLGLDTRIGFAIENRKAANLQRKNNHLFFEEHDQQDADIRESFRLYLSKVIYNIGKSGNDYLYPSHKYLKSILDDPNKTEWIDLRAFQEDYRSEILKSLLSSEFDSTTGLRLSIYARKKYQNEKFLIDSISSGESSLFSTLSFISSNISRNAWILIDEPENSLHPKWQKEYCTNLLNNFHYYEPRIVIATHSPMIVSGGSIEEIAGKIYSPNIDSAHEISRPEGVESLLMEVFGIITPKNHHLSERAQILLDDLSKDKIKINEVNKTIEEWQAMTSEDNQKVFLNDLKHLAERINQKIIKKAS